MESSPDYRSIVLSPPFTFLIGPTHTKLTIQSALARHVSQPLDHLMNNGVTRESKHRIALVEDEDPETFVAFCEYAYTADYTVPDVPVSGFGNSGGGGGGGGGDDDDLPGYRGDGRDFRSPGTASPAGIGSPVSLRFAHAYRRGSYSDVPPPVPSPPPPAPSPGRENEGDAGRAFEGDNNNDNTDAPAAAAAAADDNEHDGYIRNQTEPGEPSAYQRMNMSTDEDGEEKEDNTIRGRRRRRKQQNITPPWSPPEKDPNKSSGNNPFRGTGAATMIDTSASHWEQAVASTDDDDGGGNNETGDPRQRHKSKRAERKKTTELSLWDEFVSLNYYYYNHINNVNTRGNRRRPPHGDDGDDDNNNKNHKEDNIPYLVFHAKVYVFAIRYLIPALAQLCLKKLHRGLLNLSFPGPSPKSDFYYDEFDDEERDRAMRTTALARAKAKAKMILALLHFTYTRTTRLEPVVVQQVASGLASGTPETRLRENELRKLVVHYAACKIKDLAEYCPPAPEESGSGGGGGVVSDEKKDTTTAGSSKKNNTNAWDWGVSRGGLRGLMDNTTELASDLVYRMM